MRLRLAAGLAVSLLIFGGCTAEFKSSPSGVAPADGPASVATPSSSRQSGHETTNRSTEPETSDTPNFQQKYVFEDGLSVEVTNIKKGKVTFAQKEESFEGRVKPGQDWARFTLRLKNGGKDRIRLNAEGGGAYGMVTYGPEGTKAFGLELESDPISGTILPGKAKSATTTWIIPKEHWNDVVMEVTIIDNTTDDYDNSGRDPVVFSGSIA